MNYDDLLSYPLYAVPDVRKYPLLKEALRESFQHHYEACAAYRKISDKQNFQVSADFLLEDVPYLPIGLFKKLLLSSVDVGDVTKTLQSSGTTAQTPSLITLDNITRKRQIKTLALILIEYLGGDRLPFIIADVDPAEKVFNTDKTLPARSAAIRGFLLAATSATYCVYMNEVGELVVDLEKLCELLGKHESDGKPFVLFGFTYIMYSYIVKKLRDMGKKFQLSNMIIMHTGGWKKLQDEAVSLAVFNREVREVFGVEESNILDVYGFTEQLGLVYISRGNEPKRCPVGAEIIIRCPDTLAPVPDGEDGLIEFLTPLPHSYPGLAILSDDVGVIVGREPSASGQHGTAFFVKGRAKQAEMRGCGDILSESMV
jgi:hypothetical protein